jgi:hypothetical protein
MKLKSENLPLDSIGNGDGRLDYPGCDDRNTEGSICFRFTGQEVATADFQRFRAMFSLEMMSALALRLLRGNLVIQLPPSPALHEEPFLCETTRRFCHAFFEAFPAWGYFFSLENLALWKMSLALLPAAQFFQFERAWQTRVLLPEASFAALVASHERQTHVMARAAGMSVTEGESLAEAVRDYFQKVATAYSRP